VEAYAWWTVPSPRPDLRIVPRADRAFQLAVESLFADWWNGLATGGRNGTARDFEELLRSEYPSAKVRIQDPLATLGRDVVWYVERRDVGLGSGPGQQLPEANERSGHVPIYSAARAAAMTGLPVSVLVTWDETDGLVRPARTPGGQALYSRDDLEALIVAKKAFTAGSSPDQVRAVLAARPSRSSPGSSLEPSRRRLLILLAERDRYAAEYTEYFLRTEGYDVEVALSSEEAETRVASLQPELAVVELLISGGAGAELCARLKARSDIAILAISSLDDSDRALNAGADAFLAKPYDALAFVSAIKDLMGESALLRHSGPA
jgi:CheY-like chemotaxis protein